MLETTLVIPCYNEEKRLQPSAFSLFAQERPGVRVLFVDDGSLDETAAILAKVCGCLESAAVLRLPQNVGKAEAVRKGFLAAFETGTKYVGFWDADLATPLHAVDEFKELLDKRADLEMVFGSRVKLLGRDILRNPIRHYLGRCYATIVSLILSLPIYDTQCGAKLFRVTPTLQAIFATRFISGWVFDVEILARFIKLRRMEGAARLEECLYELPLKCWHDIPGSKVNASVLPRVCWDLWRIYLSLR